MDFIKKAKGAVKDANDLNDGLKKLGFKGASFGSKKESPASSVASPPATPATPSAAPFSPPSAAPSSPPVLTPATSTMSIPQIASSDAVPMCTAPGAPTKLSLVARKSLRDNFENNKAEHEAKLSRLLGVPWTITVDTLGVYSYSVYHDAAKSNLGGIINEYFDGSIRRIEDWLNKFGDNGRNELNRLASQHIVTLEPTSDKAVNYGTPAITGGKLRLLFRDEHFCINTAYVCDNIAEVVNEAGKASSGGSELSMAARNSIQKSYDAQIGELVQKVSKALQATITFLPNFEANYAAMLAYEKTLDMDDYDDQRKINKDWASGIGAATFDYFDGFHARLRDQNFHKDEMLREGFNESVDKNTVALRIVPGPLSRSYNDCVIEDGVLVIRTRPDYWWTNSRDATKQLMDLL